jgi:hypothetical protein
MDRFGFAVNVGDWRKVEIFAKIERITGNKVALASVPMLLLNQSYLCRGSSVEELSQPALDSVINGEIELLSSLSL